MNTRETLISALENAPAIIVPLVREVSAEVLKRRPSTQKWSAHEHACHLAEVHELFFARIAQFASEERPQIKSYNPETAMAPDALLKSDLDDSLKRFSTDRQRLVDTLRELPAEVWEREADHDEYDHYSFAIMIRHLALHDFLHAYRIEELLLKKAW
jgi:uncharacterized damage-inducible protein DinB